MQTLVETEQKRLIKKFHTLLGRINRGDIAKETILHSYGVDSSRDLSAAQLIEACNDLDKILNPKLAELDAHRKRLMASIGGWLRAMNVSSNGAKIKAIACRAAKRDNFNDIPMEQLRSLYAAFNKKQHDLRSVELLTAEYIDFLSINN
jgi:5-methylcytosine-specific restriction endonuclease McrBC GTP-binding regulatory subunit McrB